MDRVRAFEEVISAARRRAGAVDFSWYPYGTLSNTAHLGQLLGGDFLEYLEAVCPSRRILDVGCGDGELSFFLERQGFHVTSADHPSYSHNGMRGVRLLRGLLGSKIEILELDLDRQFHLPDQSFDAALFLGVLYHLRNPFYVLEELARHARHCLLSTRIARRLPDGSKMPKGAAIAYLLDEYELNRDETNYFIFSEPALQVMLRRAYWRVDRTFCTGNSKSDPVRQDRDERIFCAMESTYDRLANIELVDGWYEAEGSGWRWTQQEFSVFVQLPETGTPTLAMQIFTPAALVERFGALQLSLCVDGRELSPVLLEHSGIHDFRRRLDPAGAKRSAIRFRLSHALPGDESDARERGIIVASIRVE